MTVTAFHEVLVAKIHNLIHDKITALKPVSNESTKEFLDLIESCFAARINLGNKSFFSADNQYKVLGQLKPGIIIEVAHIQSTQNLSEKAIQYLTYSSGGIQLVVGSDAYYKSSICRLDLYIWTLTSGTIKEAVKEEICQSDHVNSGSLVIPLKAFGPPDVPRFEISRSRSGQGDHLELRRARGLFLSGSEGS
jgi:hypothetical protein